MVAVSILFRLAKLAKLIVEDVRRYIGIEIDPEQALDDYVGMWEQKNKIMNYLKPDDSDVVRVVTIYGIPGMGKTALARLVFQELKFSHFQSRAAFLSIPHGTADLMSLQKSLLQLLGENSSGITYAEEGVNWIKIKLNKKKVLIVLDGLNNEDQLSNLAGDRSWFGKGSRVIITTRDNSIITLKGECCDFYKMPDMIYDDARTLLCRNAFDSDSPPEEIDDEILREAIEQASGNPKAICEVASTLRCSRRDGWEGIIEALRKAPPMDVKGKLRIVYDNFETEGHQKEIFLDIACLFIDVEKDDATHYWKAQRYCSLMTDLEALKNRSWINIDGNKIGMST